MLDYVIQKALFLGTCSLLHYVQALLSGLDCSGQVQAHTANIEFFFDLGLVSAQILPHYDIVFAQLHQVFVPILELLMQPLELHLSLGNRLLCPIIALDGLHEGRV